jgi:hypothetical protein
MVLPATIRVAAFDIRVVEWDHMLANQERAWGEFSCIEQVIRVELVQSKWKVLDTFLHELGHAIFWAYNIKDDDKEEDTVDVQATAWTQIYRDNPHLLDWIQGIVNGEDSRVVSNGSRRGISNDALPGRSRHR